jgi:hypothetical protein
LRETFPKKPWFSEAAIIEKKLFNESHSFGLQ